MKTTEHPLVRDYLNTLTREAAALPPEHGAELVADLTEHITIALTQIPEPDEHHIRDLLERLGDPRTIVATAQEGTTPAPTTGRWHTIAPLLLLPAAAPLSALGPLPGGIALTLGLILLWTAPHWNKRDKTIATTATAVAMIGLATTGLIAATFGHPLAALLTGAAIITVIPTLACIHLFRARRRTR